MSIEGSLERIADALEKLATSASTEFLPDNSGDRRYNILDTLDKAPVTLEEKPKKKAKKKKKTPEPEPTLTLPEVTRDDILALVQQIVAMNKANDAREILNSFGANKVPELQEENFSEAHKKFLEVLNG